MEIEVWVVDRALGIAFSSQIRAKRSRVVLKLIVNVLIGKTQYTVRGSSLGMLRKVMVRLIYLR